MHKYIDTPEQKSAIFVDLGDTCFFLATHQFCGGKSIHGF